MYGTVAGWIAYALARGVTVVDETASAQSLQRASDYIRTRYVVRYGLDASSDAVIEAAISLRVMS